MGLSIASSIRPAIRQLADEVPEPWRQRLLDIHAMTYRKKQERPVNRRQTRTITPELVIKVRAFAAINTSWTFDEIGRHFPDEKGNPLLGGRVSEILDTVDPYFGPSGLRIPRDKQRRHQRIT